LVQYGQVGSQAPRAARVPVSLAADARLAVKPRMSRSSVLTHVMAQDGVRASVTSPVPASPSEAVTVNVEPEAAENWKSTSSRKSRDPEPGLDR
jgi:hypothetical protein